MIENLSNDATIIKYSVIGGGIILVSVVGLFVYEKIKDMNVKLPPKRTIHYDLIASNPITKFIQATAIRNTLNNKNSKYYDPTYKNTKVEFTNSIQSSKQLKKKYNDYSGPVIDITPTQTTGQFINMPNTTPAENKANVLGTNDNPYNFKNGWQGEGFYNHINKLVLQVYILNKNMYNQLVNKNYTSVF